MRKASITGVKDNLSALIDSLKGGSPVLIVDWGRPVARLEPVTASSESEPQGRLSRFIRNGIVRPRRTQPPATLFGSQPPRAGASVVDALLCSRSAWEDGEILGRLGDRPAPRR
jgi:antitoxin (DNA-binding transcriptional repressor) of toxin-antitoxin stability system